MVEIAKQRYTEGLPEYKENFIRMLMGSGALKVGGEFKLKSGRSSPYFFNIGGLNTGNNADELANAFAAALADNIVESRAPITIYGIPEKGVALAPTISIALSRNHNIESYWMFTRKESKTYGEATGLSKAETAKAKVVGKIPTSEESIIVVDDVLTTGGAKLDAIKELHTLVDNPKIDALLIALDRQEIGPNGKSAVQEFTEKTGIPVISIITATDILMYMQTHTQRPGGDINAKDQSRFAAYLSAYGGAIVTSHFEVSRLAKERNANLIIRPKEPSSTIIPACDMPDIGQFRELVRQTHEMDGVGGYKIGFELGLTYGLPQLVEEVRKFTNKPVIYDHQKAGTDIPDTGAKFVAACKSAGVDAVILFPQSGPETERAWIYRAMEHDLHVIIGGRMTHAAYTQSEGGFISDEGAMDIYRIAAEIGVVDFVVPGTKPEVVKAIVGEIEKHRSVNRLPVFYIPGFGAQQGDAEKIKEATGRLNGRHFIVGRAIVEAGMGNYGRATEEQIRKILRPD